MKINEEKLNETPDEILFLIVTLLRILSKHKEELTKTECELVSNAASKI